MSIGETDGMDQGTISEVLANAKSSDTREGFIAGPWELVEATDDGNATITPPMDSPTDLEPWWTAVVICTDRATQNAVARRMHAANDLLAALKAIKRFGELGCVDVSGRGYTGGKKPATKDVWQFPRHMLVEIDAAILKAESQS